MVEIAFAESNGVLIEPVQECGDCVGRVMQYDGLHSRFGELPVETSLKVFRGLADEVLMDREDLLLEPDSKSDDLGDTEAVRSRSAFREVARGRIVRTEVPKMLP